MIQPEVFEVRVIETTPEYSHVEVRLQGVNRKIINNGGDTFYRCMGGCAVFYMGGTPHPLRHGDEPLLILRGTPYQDMSPGGVILEACTIPPFDPEQITYLD